MTSSKEGYIISGFLSFSCVMSGNGWLSILNLFELKKRWTNWIL